MQKEEAAVSLLWATTNWNKKWGKNYETKNCLIKTVPINSCKVTIKIYGFGNIIWLKKKSYYSYIVGKHGKMKEGTFETVLNAYKRVSKTIFGNSVMNNCIVQ